jgi:phenylalanyl-tRNA synthetase alpha chain
MQNTIDALHNEIITFNISSKEQLEEFRLLYLTKKGKINQLFSEFKNVPNDQKKVIGKSLNTLKETAQQKYNESSSQLESVHAENSKTDLTLPAFPYEIGSRHPLSIVRSKIIDIFKRIGYTVSDGPEVEDDWHVFSALNFPPEHPARDMQDTFFISNNPDILLRTHTSSIQVRVMENEKPPIRTICPGRVFRNEAISARAHCIFHQIEGLYIDVNVSFADLKQTLMYFAQELFGPSTKTRFRPSFFPFTEPSAEMDVQCNICGGNGCNVCKYSGWLEILGCGMVDPHVLDFSNIDSKKYTGLAFGMGIERITQLLYKVNDLRLYFENEKRFLDQFKAFN